MIYQIFSIILSALFLMCVFLAVWYIAIPLLVVAIVLSAIGAFLKKVKGKAIKRQQRHRPIHAHDVIDVDFKEVK